jgi:Domain of unknown function (DUF1995)
MADLPQSLDEAITQAQQATQAAIAAGYNRLQVEFSFPELKALPIAEKFFPAFAEMGSGLKVFFTDAGLAALARRDWGEVACQIRSLDVAGSRQTTSVEEQVDPQDQLYLFISPTAVEVGPVEQIAKAAGDRPIVLLNPRLEDVAIIGIGYAGRQLRERFLNTIEPCYFLRPIDDQSTLIRCYPEPWQVWSQVDGTYRLIAEELQKPDSEKLAELLAKAPGVERSRPSLLAGLQQFLRALSN